MVIALLGMGVVGSGVVEIAERTDGIQIKKILATRVRRPDMTADFADIIGDSEIELIAEAMGGLHPAYECAKAALESGRHFVTANKLLVCEYGAELCAIARDCGCAFLYSAACGGGIPYLTNLNLARGFDTIEALGGILNGTTNFILDSMQRQNMDYAEALDEAQHLGYAERDPSSDVNGLDTMRKLVLACGVGFDARIAASDIPTAGIASIRAQDIAYAKSRGMSIRLCAHAERRGDRVSAYVEPEMLSQSAPESAILKNVNYAWYRGACSGLMSFSGQGAGKLPTATNVIRDIRAAMAGRRYMTSPACAPAQVCNDSAIHPYYLRMPLMNRAPEFWIVDRAVDDHHQYIETIPVSVSDMHAFMAGKKDSFFAGIRKGQA